VAEASLEGPRAKVKRARKHLDCLNAEMRAFADEDPYAVIDKFDPQTLKYEAWFDVRREPDAITWGILLGDFLHNLRSALDHLVGQLVLLSGGKKIEGTQYPIVTSGTDYWCIPRDGSSSKRNWMLKGVAEKYRTAIDQTQPYRAGQDASRTRLALLSALSNADKHRFIHPAWAFMAPVRREHFNVTTSAEWAILDVEVPTGELKHGTKILTASLQLSTPDADVDVKGNLPIDIGFGQRRGGRGGIPAPALGSLADRVEEVVEAFSPFFPAPQAAQGAPPP
jgi:hypothetical protein